MTPLEYFALASALATLLIGIEWWASRERQVYALGDTLSNFGCGLGQELFSALSAPFFAAALARWQSRFALVQWPESSLVQAAIAVVGSDLIYYWYHRLGHRVSVAWMIHEVHHQSEHFNFAVALRQSWLTAWAWLPLYPLLACLGVTPNGFMLAAAVMTLYQLFLHTTLVGDLGPLGWVFNTPAFHRVHHARDPRFFAPGASGANFGAIFVIWDRMFGTFVDPCSQSISSDDEIAYGTMTPVPFLSPFKAQIRGWSEVVARVRKADSICGILQCLFGAPTTAGPGLPEQKDRLRFIPDVGFSLASYGLVQFALALAATVFVEHGGGGPTERICATLFAVASLVVMGAWLDRKPFALWLDLGRWTAILAALMILR